MDIWWAAFAAVVSLLALGVATMSVVPITHGAFWIAKVSFLLATIIAAGGMGIWLAYSDQSPVQPWTLRWTLLVVLAVGVPGGLGVGLLRWIAQVEEKQLAPDKIQLYIGNASVFNYLGATPENRYRLIDPSKPVEVELDPSRFVSFNTGIQNDNEGISLEDVRLHVKFKKSDRLEIRLDNDGEGGVWRTEETNEHYWYKFPNPIHNGSHPWNMFSVKFSRPDIYIFEYTIEGKGLPKISRSMQIKVTSKPAANP